MQIILTSEEYDQLKALAVPEPLIQARAEEIAFDYRTRLLKELTQWIPLHALTPGRIDALRNALTAVPLKEK